MCVIRTRCANPGTHPLKRHSWMFCFIRSGNSSSIFIEKSILEELLTLPPPSLPSYHTKTMNMMMWEENLQMAQHESGMWIATYIREQHQRWNMGQFQQDTVGHHPHQKSHWRCSFLKQKTTGFYGISLDLLCQVIRDGNLWQSQKQKGQLIWCDLTSPQANSLIG